MKALNNIWATQKEYQGALSDNLREEKIEVIQFKIGGSLFAVDISYLSEVSELLDQVPYPEEVCLHVGIVNLRGSLVPVVQFANPNGTENLLAFLEFKPGAKFAICVSHPKKMEYSKSALDPTSGVIRHPEKVIRLLSFSDFAFLESGSSK